MWRISAARPAFTAAAAAPNAAIAATFSVPARLPRSCPPPLISGSAKCSASSRLISAPAPFAPPNLWALSVIRSAPSALMSSGMRPAACTASTCSSPPCRCTIAAASATGWMTPVSLFAAMSETSARPPARQAFARAQRDRPRRSRANRNLLDVAPPRTARQRAPRDARSPRPAGDRMGASRPPTSMTGVSASAFASVPPEVKITLRGSAPTSAATSSRACSTTAAPPGPRRAPRTDCRSGPAPPRARRAPPTRSGALAFQSR